MSADPNACCCGGGAGNGHLVDCPADAPTPWDVMSRRTLLGLGWPSAPELASRFAFPPEIPVFAGLDLGRSRDRVALRCGCGQVIRLDGGSRLLLAAQMVLDVRPTNWADDEDPDQVAAWSALEEAVRAETGGGQ
jgi:hypothetical protein